MPFRHPVFGSHPSAVPRLVQEVAKGYTSSSASTVVLTLSSITTRVGNFLIVAGGGRGGAITGVTDSKGNTWQVDVSASNAVSNGASASLASCRITVALVNGDTITVTIGGNAGYYKAATVAEYSGLAATGRVDKVASAIGTSAASNSGATASTTGAALLVGVTAIGGSGSGPGGFAAEVLSPVWSLNTAVYVPSGYPSAIRPMNRMVFAPGTYSEKASWSGSQVWSAVIAAYKANDA